MASAAPLDPAASPAAAGGAEIPAEAPEAKAAPQEPEATAETTAKAQEAEAAASTPNVTDGAASVTEVSGAAADGRTPARDPSVGELRVQRGYVIQDPEEAVPEAERAARRALLASISQADASEGRGRKKRPRDARPDRGQRLCYRLACFGKCNFEGQNCKFSHDVKAFFDERPPDLGPSCHMWETYGFCKSGLNCRYGAAHLDPATGGNLRREASVEPAVERNELQMPVAVALRKNAYPFYRPRKDSRHAKKEAKTRQDEGLPVYVPPKEPEAGSADGPKATNGSGDGVPKETNGTAAPAAEPMDLDQDAVTVPEPTANGHHIEAPAPTDAQAAPASTGPATETDAPSPSLSPYPAQPRKLVDFRDKVYVAPLTTVGNLPFRRILKSLGTDITCGEMSLVQNLLAGSRAEWSLLRRAPEEDVFGVQIAGAYRDQLARCGELIRAQVDCDFVDLNLGCPIDVVCEKGAGSALMNRPHRVSEIVRGMAESLWCVQPPPYAGRLSNATDPVAPIQLTVKMRTGWLDSRPVAHFIIRRTQTAASEVGGGAFGPVAAVMVHGRSRLQRYTRLADWSYIGNKAGSSQDPALPRIPLIGNGDLFNYEEWEQRKAAFAEGRTEAAEAERDGMYAATAAEAPSGAVESPEEAQDRSFGIETCAMLARGALIKPWLPIEIKEQRHWDISAGERLDLLRKFCNFGMEHWGSDDIGVNSTRRFLLEWLSFSHRYVPVGLIEADAGPQKINLRPPRFRGRSDLESLMGSDQAVDWVRISEMLLGPVPENFRFTPRHKANSYSAGGPGGSVNG